MKKTVTIGIPAYNEEKNITHLVSDILGQTQKYWVLQEILIYSDGSQDNTVNKVSKIKSAQIKIMSSKIRKGKSVALNQILNKSNTDIIVLFDADVRLANRNVIENLLKGFDHPNIMLVAGNKSPYPPKNFIEKGIYSTFKVFYESKIKLNGGNNIFGCQGGCLALRRELADLLHLPRIISEDAYFYLFCIMAGYKFNYVDQAIVYYKNASNLTDYLKQLFRSRPASVNIFLKKYFGDLVQQEFHRPLSFYASSIFKVLLENPLPTIFIILVNLVATPFIPFIARRYEAYWPVAKSTK